MNVVKERALKALRCVALILAIPSANGARAQVSQQIQPQPPPQSVSKDLGLMSIEDLMNLEVTSGAKKEESVQRTAAAIFVITSEDIRRSGATTLPDVLRVVPGLDVAQINGSTWAVSSRGFNDEFANKMLVLVDGRTVYSALFSGVFWDSLDIFLADIDRIEVIRGPGAALWGTNAVNGVINIITKKADQTQGGLLTVGGGDVEGGYGAAQYGGKLGRIGSFRVFTKGFSKISFPGSPGQGPQNGWDLEHAGFRTDLKLSDRDSLTLEGDLFQSFAQGTTSYTTSLDPLVSGLVPGTRRTTGGNLLAKWTRTTSPTSEVSLQAYYDDVDTTASIIGLKVSTLDVEFQDQFAIGARSTVVWGVDFKHVRIGTEGTVAASLAPANTVENLASGFIQDEIEIVPSKLRLTLGGRIQQDYSAGQEFQPDVRLLWTPTSRHAIWLAGSRAFRGLTPADTNVTARLGAVPSGFGPLVVPETLGNPAMKSESAIAIQTGYRTIVTKSFSIATTGFYNIYSHLRGQDAGAPILETGPGPLFLIQPETFNNKVNGETHGIEMFFTWKPFSPWKISGGYTWFAGSFRDSSIGASPSATTFVHQSPAHQFNIRSSLNLPHRFEFDAALYRVGGVSTQVFVPGYFRLDARLGWRAGENFDISVVGQNLLTPQHFEFNNPNDLVTAAATQRSFYGKFTWRFALSPAK